MNKKGFTLIEVIAIIAILGVIMTLVVPRILSSLNGGIEKTMKVQEDEIREAGLLYLEDMCKNPIGYGTCPSTITYDDATNSYSGKVSLDILVSSKYIDKIMHSGESCSACVVFNNNDATAYLKCGTTYENPNYSTKCN